MLVSHTELTQMSPALNATLSAQYYFERISMVLEGTLVFEEKRINIYQNRLKSTQRQGIAVVLTCSNLFLPPVKDAVH